MTSSRAVTTFSSTHGSHTETMFTMCSLARVVPMRVTVDQRMWVSHVCCGYLHSDLLYVDVTLLSVGRISRIPREIASISTKKVNRSKSYEHERKMSFNFILNICEVFK